jgi:hypothetical protein
MCSAQTRARIYRPSFPENKPKTLVFSHTKRALSPCFRENWVYNFGHRTGIGLLGKPPAVKQFPSIESHLGVCASYATWRKRRYEANKCG